MAINESLARGLCLRFFREVGEDYQKISKNINYFVLRGRKCKKNKTMLTIFRNSKIDIVNTELGSNTNPYACTAVFAESREWPIDGRTESVLTARLYIDQYKRYGCSNAYLANFSVSEHAIARLFLRLRNKIEDAQGYQIHQIRGDLAFIPGWAEFWGDLWFDLPAKLQNKISPIIPSTNGLFLCQMDSDGFVNVRTFIENSMLSPLQKKLRQKLLDIVPTECCEALAFNPLSKQLGLENLDSVIAACRMLLEPLTDELVDVLLVPSAVDEEKQMLRQSLLLKKRHEAIIASALSS